MSIFQQSGLGVIGRVPERLLYSYMPLYVYCKCMLVLLRHLTRVSEKLDVPTPKRSFTLIRHGTKNE